MDEASLCCPHCFSNPTVRDFIEENGECGDCEFCGAIGVQVVDASELRDVLEPLIGIYKPLEIVPECLRGGVTPCTIGEILSHEWDIVDDADTADRLARAIYEPRTKDDLASDLPDPESELVRPEEFWGSGYEELESDWNNFAEEMRRTGTLGPSSLARVEEILSYCGEMVCRDGREFFRARSCTRGRCWERHEMGKPPAHIAPAGRANPAGTSFLYLGSSRDVVVSEMAARCPPDQDITIGRFVVVHEFRILDLRGGGRIGDPLRYCSAQELASELNRRDFLDRFGLEVSRPIAPMAGVVEYRPTQYLCELIRRHGHASVAYNSQFGGGFNLAVFDGSELECVESVLHPMP